MENIQNVQEESTTTRLRAIVSGSLGNLQGLTFDEDTKKYHLLTNSYSKIRMKPIINARQFQEIAGNENLIIIDATSGADATSLYSKKHVKGAQFVSLETDLSAVKDPVNGGRHPLPSAKDFSHTLSRLGIRKDSHIVVYDRLGGANAAARFWWMAKAAGIANVQVLDGGYQAAEAAGYPVEEGKKPHPDPSNFQFDNWDLPTRQLQDVDRLTSEPESLIIDVREAARYQGISEPLDLIAGHIPSAVNIPFHNNLDKDGFFKTPEALKRVYDDYLHGKKMEHVVIHCGSGVTACHSLLAIAHAGYSLPSLYVGSWSEWSRHEKPIQTGE